MENLHCKDGGVEDGSNSDIINNDANQFEDVPTSLVPLVESEHGRLRRRQRGITMKDLKAALKYGKRQSCRAVQGGDPVAMYTYKDVVYIVNERIWKEVTSYAVPFVLDSVPITETMRTSHIAAKTKIQSDLDCWTSNTVIVVDTSGSMRKADVWGARDRLGSVWLSVALDFLAHRLDTKSATNTDIISIITLQNQLVVREEPSSWILYNKLVQLCNGTNTTVRAHGHGPFLPALTTAEQLLTRNPNSACALALLFLSDGRPSDFVMAGGLSREEWSQRISSRVGLLARRFGRRLTFTGVGIGDMDNFDTLSNMKEAASEYHAKSMLLLPSMSTCAVGSAFSSLASSLTSTQSEMTDLRTMKQMKVRNVLRESRQTARKPIQTIPMFGFRVFMVDDALVERLVYVEWREFRRTRHNYQKHSLQHPDACGIAMCKEAFGEGAERFVFRFYEVAADGRTIVGKPLVAKESRLVLDADEIATIEARRREFVKTFCSAQQLAKRLAQEFNNKLRRIPIVDPSTPGVSMLDCSIYVFNDPKLGERSVLVEERLDESKWQKWNSNNGYVKGMKSAPSFSGDRIRQSMKDIAQVGLDHDEDDNDDERNPTREKKEVSFDLSSRSLDGSFTIDRSKTRPALGVVEEEEDEEEEEEEDKEEEDKEEEDEEEEDKEEEEEMNSKEKGGPCDPAQVNPDQSRLVFTPFEVAQAFSHFSYYASGKKRLVCDLQGVFDEKENILKFSDPVIHYNDEKRTGVHGRTDRGCRGIAIFLETHKCHCGKLCKLMNRGYYKYRRSDAMKRKRSSEHSSKKHAKIRVGK